MKSSVAVVFYFSVVSETEQISDLTWPVFVLFLQSRKSQLNEIQHPWILHPTVDKYYQAKHSLDISIPTLLPCWEAQHSLVF